MALSMSSNLNEFGAPRGTMGLSNHICDSTPCFGLLHGCMPRNITPSDLDGIVEINGKFWVIEFKKTGKEVPKGQMFMFNHFINMGFAVSIIWHDGLTRENKITKMKHMISGQQKERVFNNYQEGRESYQKFARWWSGYKPKAISKSIVTGIKNNPNYPLKVVK